MNAIESNTNELINFCRNMLGINCAEECSLTANYNQTELSVEINKTAIPRLEGLGLVRVRHDVTYVVDGEKLTVVKFVISQANFNEVDDFVKTILASRIKCSIIANDVSDSRHRRIANGKEDEFKAFFSEKGNQLHDDLWINHFKSMTFTKTLDVPSEGIVSQARLLKIYDEWDNSPPQLLSYYLPKT